MSQISALINMLLSTTSDPEVKEAIHFMDRPAITRETDSGKLHVALNVALTHIASVADRAGDTNAAQAARDMRDELDPYIEQFKPRDG